MDTTMHAELPGLSMFGEHAAVAPYAVPDSGGASSRFNDFYLLAPVGYFVLSFDTTILQMNVVGADLLGL